jgi:hypothetical protein
LEYIIVYIIKGDLYTMEYSKDIILSIGNERVVNRKGQADNKFINSIKKHRIIATVILLCGILILLDFILINNFIILLQEI